MKQPFFTGACTALVTPFLGGKVNYPMMEQLLRRQIETSGKVAHPVFVEDVNANAKGFEYLYRCTVTGE